MNIGSIQDSDINCITHTVSHVLRDILDYARDVKCKGEEAFVLSRPQLIFISSKTTQCEEMLDNIGARKNQRWFPIRETIALLKNYSSAAYEIIHVFHSAQSYNAQESVERFRNDTRQHTEKVTHAIFSSLVTLYKEADELGLLMAPREFDAAFSETEDLPRLPADRKPKSQDCMTHHINTLAINVLNTTEDVKNFKKLAQAKVTDWDSLDFDFLCETKFQNMKVNMHVLLSMYDTYISASPMEASDNELKQIRGRISGTYHLLSIAAIYIHYYERHIRPHVMNDQADAECNSLFSSLAERDIFYGQLLHYLAYYITQFLTEARKLCMVLLRKYCVTKTVEVSIPPYVGFHVRPSTMVAAISLHYGGGVKLILGETEYDASSFPNITLANNYLDQKKRAYILEKLDGEDFGMIEQFIAAGKIDRTTAVRQILLRLASMNLIKLYRAPLDMEKIPKDTGKSLRDFVFDTIVFMMNTDRQLGIVYNATVTFTGPEQAVDDIATLAKANYCESETGEDLPLPRQLDYLNFKRKKA